MHRPYPGNRDSAEYCKQYNVLRFVSINQLAPIGVAVSTIRISQKSPMPKERLSSGAATCRNVSRATLAAGVDLLCRRHIYGQESEFFSTVSAEWPFRLRTLYVQFVVFSLDTGEVVQTNSP